MTSDNILLLGGDGFLGRGLQRAFTEKHVPYISRDILDYDLSDLKKNDGKAKLLEDLKVSKTVVLLAAKIGAKLFESDQAEDMALYNRRINIKIFSALAEVAKLYKKSFNVVFYSTSEVFGDLTENPWFGSYDTAKKYYSFDYLNPRHHYSFEKMITEQEYEGALHIPKSPVERLLVVYPFNVSGFGQRRGVFYEMLESAICHKEIKYRADTTRTLTDIDLASGFATDKILELQSKPAGTSNRIALCDSSCTVTMKHLAKSIASMFDEKIKLVKLPVDTSIQHRHMEEPDKNLEAISKFTKKWAECLSCDIRAQI